MQICCIGALPCAAQQSGTRWTPRLIRDAQRWKHAPDDPSIAVVEKGLRVMVPPERTWRIAAADRIRLPEHVARIRLHIAELGSEASWFVRVYGDLRAGGPPRTVGFFQDETRVGAVTLVLDPRLLPQQHHPLLQVQLGVEGRPDECRARSEL